MKWFAFGAAGVALAGWLGSARLVEPLRELEPAAEQPALDPAAIELVRSALQAEQAGDTLGARSGYLQSVSLLPPIGDHLRLRVAALTSDSIERSELYQAVTSPAVGDQVRPVEARIRERLGDFAGAAAVFRDLGRPGDAFRVRLAGLATREDSTLLLHELVAWVKDSSTAGARGVLAAALPLANYLPTTDLLILARASDPVTSAAPAARYYELSRLGGARLAQEDHAAWGEALYNTGQYRSSIPILRNVTSGPRVPKSLLLRGRATIRARLPGGKSVLEDLIRRFPNDSQSTPTALFLLGDLSRDARDFAAARQRWVTLGKKFPRHELAPRARFLAALVSYTQNRRREAALEWDSLFTQGGETGDALAAGYWSGRTWAALGDSVRARERWQDVTRRSRLSYYARLSHDRLGLSDTTLTATSDSFQLSDDLRAAEERLGLLSATGLLPELGVESRWLAARAGDDSARVAGTASLLRRHQQVALTAQLGWRALGQGVASSTTYRLIFPVYFDTILKQESEAKGIEPALVAALIRQESLFDSMATSRAGARGLMQLMPAVAGELAAAAGRTSWHADSLYQSAINIQLGTTHLRWALARYGGLERTLAAYNAGGSRVTQWDKLPGAGDPEVFVEWIPFEETRTYVRTVMRNLTFYRALYRW